MTTKSPAASANTGKAPPRWAIKAMTRTHVFLNRLTGGRMFNSLGGDDVCFVTMKGAKSGRTLTIPLMYVPYRERSAPGRVAGRCAAEPRLVQQPREASRDRGASPRAAS